MRNLASSPAGTWPKPQQFLAFPQSRAQLPPGPGLASKVYSQGLLALSQRRDGTGIRPFASFLLALGPSGPSPGWLPALTPPRQVTSSSSPTLEASEQHVSA